MASPVEEHVLEAAGSMDEETHPETHQRGQASQWYDLNVNHSLPVNSFTTCTMGKSVRSVQLISSITNLLTFVGPGEPNMSPHLLKEFILSDRNSASGAVALITCVGLPGCKKSSQTLMQKMLQKEFGIKPEELMKVAEVTEEENEFCIYELGAVGVSKKTWQWYPFTKRSRYLSCFVSSL